MEHTFVDDQDENGDTVIWSEFFVDVMKDENARLLISYYEKDLPVMKEKFSKPKNLPQDLVAILKYVDSEECREKEKYIRLVYSQNKEIQKSLDKKQWKNV